MEEGKADKIVQIARLTFERDGVRSTTISTIMREAGITRELFYYYFKNKAQLIDAVLDAYAQDVAASVRRWSDCLDAGEEKFADLVGHLRAFLDEGNESCRNTRAVICETESYYAMAERVVSRSVEALRSTQFFRLCERCSPVPAEQGIAYVINAMLGMLRSGAGTSDKVITLLSREALCLPASL